MILAIDTAWSRMSVALAHEGRILASILNSIPNAHDKHLAPAMQFLFETAEVDRGRVHAVAVSSGPGSFTGLRIGMAAGKGIALALSIPLIPVPTFDALAHAVAQRIFPHETAVFAPVYDARRGNAYFGVFTLRNGDSVCERPAAVATPDAIAGELPEGAWIAGDAAASLMGTHTKKFHIIEVAETVCLAESVALRAENMHDRGIWSDAASVEPLYIHEVHTTTPRPFR